MLVYFIRVRKNLKTCIKYGFIQIMDGIGTIEKKKLKYLEI